MPLDSFFSKALKNIERHGDTDIFPYPIETFVFRDKKTEIIALLKRMAGNLDEHITRYPPAHASALTAVNYTGFRWATQLDPLWNAYFLGIVLSIAEEIENTRIPKQDNIVFSYRYKWDAETADIFDNNYGWKQFMLHSLSLAGSFKYVVTCDISEFYPNINHHRLENSLRQVGVASDAPASIMKFLSYYSNTYSFGMPVGGPAARLLSEILLDQIDRLLLANNICFCRFADDYHLFASSYDEAFKALLFLTERLFQNQGLQLQKSKTRIMTGAEFHNTSPFGSLFSDGVP